MRSSGIRNFPPSLGFLKMVGLNGEKRDHSLANRHSCSTSAETRDWKCFIMQLILVVCKADMINQIIRFVRCYHFVDSYCQLILLKKS